jgi:hypothetical protein
MRFLPSVEMTEWIRVKLYPATGCVLSSYNILSHFRFDRIFDYLLLTWDLSGSTLTN